MGASMTAIVEWTHDANCVAEGWPPGPDGLQARWGDDHIHGVLFETDKEYDFFAAIAGARNRFARAPLYPRRGVPPNLSGPARDYFRSYGGKCSSWLHASEVDAAVRHLVGDDLQAGFELRIGLDLLRSLAERSGDANVRLVFEIESA